MRKLRHQKINDHCLTASHTLESRVMPANTVAYVAPEHLSLIEMGSMCKICLV